MTTKVTYFHRFGGQTYLDKERIIAKFENHRFTTDDPEVIEYLDNRPDIGTYLWQEGKGPEQPATATKIQTEAAKASDRETKK